MNRLFFRSNLDGTDLKVAIPVCGAACLAFLLAILGLVPESVLKFQVGGVPTFRLLVLSVLGLGSTLLLPLVGKLVPSLLAAVPKTISIGLSMVILSVQLLNMPSHGLVLGLAVVVWFMVGVDRFFENPHPVVNFFVSGLRISETIIVLVSTWFLFGLLF